MSIHSNTQICGTTHTIRIRHHHDADWIEIKCGEISITMNPIHVRALTAALDAYEAAKEKEPTK